MRSDNRKTVAIIGASSQRHKYGNKAVRAFTQAGWKVFPVNLGTDRIEGLGVFASVRLIPERLDRVSIYLPPDDTLEILDSLADLGLGEVWLNPGSADHRVRQRAGELGLPVVEGCSIVDIGLSPADFP